MAGAVPQQRGGSNTSTVVMVISIVVAVLLLGVLIWLITMQTQLRESAESANKASKTAQTARTDADRNAATLARMLGGNDKDSPQTAVKKFEDALGKVAGDEKVANKDQFTSAFGAAGVIDNLYKLYSDERTARETAESDRDKSLRAQKEAQDKLAQVEKNFGSDLAAMSKKVGDLQTAKAEFEKLKTADIEALQSQITSKQDALANMQKSTNELRSHLRDELTARDRLVEEQKMALANLRGPAAEGAQELATARKPVGNVMRALPGNSLVHIDLGRENNVQLGMTFTVYSADTRVPVDGRGKAAIEVVGLGQKTAECKVVTPAAPDDPILEGDRVGNIIISREKGRRPRFAVVGDFDIDNNGSVDINGAQAVKALITRWGGQVTDSVDATTDYLVMGAEPRESSAPVIKAAAPKAAAAPAPAKASANKPAEGEEPAEAEGGEEEKPAAEGTEESAPAEAAKPAPAAPKIEKAQEKDLTAGTRGQRVDVEREKYESAVHRAEKFAIPRLREVIFFNFVGLEAGPRAAAALMP